MNNDCVPDRFITFFLSPWKHFQCLKHTCLFGCVVCICSACVVKLMKTSPCSASVLRLCMCLHKLWCAELSWPPYKASPWGLSLVAVPVLHCLKAQSGSFLLIIWFVMLLLDEPPTNPSVFLCYFSFVNHSDININSLTSCSSALGSCCIRWCGKAVCFNAADVKSEGSRVTNTSWSKCEWNRQCDKSEGKSNRSSGCCFSRIHRVHRAE